jgi:putative iron-dependent peroxidase
MSYEHDLAAFRALPIAQQEAVIGRTKRDSVELDDATKPPSAHIARVVLEDEGAELEIYRRSVPFGGVGRHGLRFVAFSADPTRVTRMLDRMYGTSGDGQHDRLMEFSRAAGGANYFAPAEETLAAVATR